MGMTFIKRDQAILWRVLAVATKMCAMSEDKGSDLDVVHPCNEFVVAAKSIVDKIYLYKYIILIMEKSTALVKRAKATDKGMKLNVHQQRAREALQKFRIVFSSVKKHFRDVEALCGVSGVHLWAIAEISHNPGLRVTELAQSLSMHQSTTSNLLGEIERMGYIKKERTRDDQRVVRLYLTKKGDGLVARAPRPMIGVLPDALQRLPDKKLVSLNDSMDALIALMQHKDKSAATRPLSEI